MTQNPIAVFEVGNTLGEGILWDDREQCAWWTDIEANKLYRLDWRTREITLFNTPERLASFGLTDISGCLVAAFETGFALYWPADNRIRWFDRPVLSMAGIRFNDGRVDRQGRFWSGTMIENRHAELDAALYCLSPDGSILLKEKGLRISNGLCWSPDGKVMYFADSARQKIYTYDYTPANGDIANRKTWAKLEGEAYPDGACVDADGYIWSATWAAGQVNRYHPDGRLDRYLELPTSQPSCVAFGGPKLDLLFVTSARADLTADALASDTQAGHLFVYATNARGLPECRFPAISHIN